MDGLPPELTRLADDLELAAERAVRRRRRHELLGRLGFTGITGALVFAALTPAMLAPAERIGDDVSVPPPVVVTAAATTPACDLPPSSVIVAACRRAGTDDPRYVIHRSTGMR